MEPHDQPPQKRHKANHHDLWEAVSNGNLKQVRAALDTGEHANQTVLWVASQKGYKEICTLLLEHGAAVDGDIWEAPLTFASFEGHIEVCRLLLNWGASVDKEDGGGLTPLSHAGAAGHIEVCKLLLDWGADINHNTWAGLQLMSTPLIFASGEGQKEVCALFLDRGADVNKRDEEGRSALLEASTFGHKEICSLLLTHGASMVGVYRLTNALTSALCEHPLVVFTEHRIFDGENWPGNRENFFKIMRSVLFIRIPPILPSDAHADIVQTKLHLRTTSLQHVLNAQIIPIHVSLILDRVNTFLSEKLARILSNVPSRNYQTSVESLRYLKNKPALFAAYEHTIDQQFNAQMAPEKARFRRKYRLARLARLVTAAKQIKNAS